MLGEDVPIPIFVPLSNIIESAKVVAFDHLLIKLVVPLPANPPPFASTYDLTAALVGIVVLLLKFSIPSVEVTNCVIVTPVPVSFNEPHSSTELTLKSPAVFK